MRSWTPERIAQAAGARLAAPAPHQEGPLRVTIDSREVCPGDLFVGLPGETHDGGRFAAQALAAGAWGVLVAPQHAEDAKCAPPGALLAHEDPLQGLQSLARVWRRELGAPVIAITGSTGKTSTKDILAALLESHRTTFVSRGNFNTEIGLPLELLAAPAGTEALVLEMGMRGAGQIRELAAIAEPDVGVIVNIGPAHLELLGSIEAIAAAKAELIADLHERATAVIPANEPLLDPHRREDIATVADRQRVDRRREEPVEQHETANRGERAGDEAAHRGHRHHEQQVAEQRVLQAQRVPDQREAEGERRQPDHRQRQSDRPPASRQRSGE